MPCVSPLTILGVLAAAAGVLRVPHPSSAPSGRVEGVRGKGEVPWSCRRRPGLGRVEPRSAVVVALRRAEADERETWATQIGLFVWCHGVRSAQWQSRETLGTAEPSHPLMSLVRGRVCNHLYLDPSCPLTPILSLPTMIGRRVYMPSRGSTSVYCCSQEGEAKANLPSPTEANKPPPPSKPTSRRSSPSSTRCSRRLTLPDKV